MKHRFWVILHVMITIVLTVVMLTSGSAEAVNMKLRTSGDFAFIDFFNDSNYQTISGFVQVSEEMIKFAPGSPVRPGPMGFLTISIDNTSDDDNCYGYDCYDYKWGSATIELTSFEISGSLRSASAEGKGTLIWEQSYYYPYEPYPYQPPEIPPFPPYPPPPPPPPSTEEVTIKITWTGGKDMESGHNNIRSTYGDIRTHMRSSGTFRYATATGLIKGETFEVEVKPPPPPEPYPTPVPIPGDIEDPEPGGYYPPYPYPDPYPYPAPYPYYYATIGRSRIGYISIYKP